MRRVVRWLDDHDGAVTAAATVVIAVLTGLYVHYSKAQWQVTQNALRETRKSNRLASRNTRKQLRAYVTVIGIEYDGRTEDGRAEIHLVMKNGGVTPAVDFEWTTVAFTRAFDEPLPPSEPFSQCPREFVKISTAIISPGETTIPQRVLLSPAKIPGLDQAEAGISDLYVYGCLTYRDVFGLRHDTEYCWTTPHMLQTASKPSPLSKQSQFMFCPYRNHVR